MSKDSGKASKSPEIAAKPSNGLLGISSPVVLPLTAGAVGKAWEEPLRALAPQHGVFRKTHANAQQNCCESCC
jgi:hypothetical protein